MNWSSEKYHWLSLWLGFALASVWGVISLAHAYDRNLTKVNDSFTQGCIVTGRLGAILDALDRLSVDQQAFLSTGDGRFQDGVIESAETLELNIDMLNAQAAKSKSPPPLLSGLSDSIRQVLDSVGESDNIRDARSPTAAAAFFESKDTAISLAKWQANQLRVETTRSMSARVRQARGSNALFEAILYVAPAGTGLGQGVSFSNSVRLTGR